MPIVVNLNYRPILHAYFQGAITDTAVKAYLVESDQSLATGLPYVLILEAMTLSTLSSQQRKLFAQWITQNHAALQKLCFGQAYVVSNVLQRMIIRSVFMISEMPVPYAIFKTTEEAWGWSIAQLEKAKVSFEERIREVPSELVEVARSA